ncbi:MAG TPA: GntR family transcriptional regulator [Pseudonocardiaceae bacterium]|jgi:DNA-binding GntR family transcriptional regulator
MTASGETEALAEVSLLDRLRLAIVHGELTPGQRLVEADLAMRFNGSRGAVREALVLLENEGLIARQRNRGASVRPVSLDEAIEITEVRAVLEGLCAAKAATGGTAADRRKLKSIATAMQKAVKQNDVLAYSSTSQEAHLYIREMAKQQTASIVLDRLRYQSVRYQFSVAMLPARPAQGLKEHLAVIDAVTSRSPDDAEQTMRAHLTSVIGALRQLAAMGVFGAYVPPAR